MILNFVIYYVEDPVSLSSLSIIEKRVYGGRCIFYLCLIYIEELGSYSFILVGKKPLAEKEAVKV